MTRPASRLSPLLVAIAFAASSLVILAHPAPAMAWDAGSFSSGSEKTLVSLTNRSRTSAGLRALKVDSTLSSIARWRSKDMIERNYFSHDIPGFGSVFKRLDQKGFCYRSAGENIGWNTNGDSTATAAIHRAFMDSSGHRNNILGRSWDVIGIGAYKGASGKKMWTVLFADKCGTVSNPKPKPTPKATPKPKPRAQATSRPTPRPTPRPAPKPKPTPTPPPTFSAVDLHPAAETDGGPTPGRRPVPPSPGASSDAPPPARSEHGRRIEAATSPGGIIEAIVGTIAGRFFGS